MARVIKSEEGGDQSRSEKQVGISFISGNFDESVFENPCEINIKREKIPHLSFGFRDVPDAFMNLVLTSWSGSDGVAKPLQILE